jgi:hypothetical protein
MSGPNIPKAGDPLTHSLLAKWKQKQKPLTKMRGFSWLGNEVEVSVMQDGDQDQNEGRMNGVDIVSTSMPVSEDGG